MKLVIDEKLKHRLVGLAVIISLGMIFIPAMVKKSGQKIEGNFSVNMNLPKKPILPDVAEADEDKLFKTIKVSRVELPGVSGEKQLPKLVHAEPLNVDSDIMGSAVRVAREEGTQSTATQVAATQGATTSLKGAVKVASKEVSKRPIQVAISKPIPKLVAKPQARQTMKSVVAGAKKAVNTRQVYAVQLASFSQLNNAQTLVNKLHASGYKATMVRISGRMGPIYKVFSGHSPNKNEALRIKGQLASKMQLNGFVVNTGVS